MKFETLAKILMTCFLLFSKNLYSSTKIEEESVLKIKQLLTTNYQCKNNKPFWKIKKVSVPRRTHSIPSLSNPLGKKIKDHSKYELRYSIFGCDLGKKGSIVIIPGRGEGSVEFYETAREFINRGYSPIFVMDPRGQGLSPRLLDLQKGHVENFNHYISDFEYMVKNVKAYLQEIGGDKSSLFYLSNSMGAGIGLGYFMRNTKTPFKAAAMLGPMIRINYLAFNNKKPTWFNNLLYSENGAILQATLKCNMNKCNEYADKNKFGEYKSGKRNFQPDNENKMTHSRARYNFKTYLLDEFDWKSIKKQNYHSNENWNGLGIGGATFNWVLTSTFFLKYMKSKEGIESLTNIPFNLIAGENDNRIYRPYLNGNHDLSRIKSYCDRVNQLNKHKNSKLCTLTPIKNGFHELLKERDEIRLKAINKAVQFFDSI